MKRVMLPALLGLLLVVAFGVSAASAATGVVIWTNPPENKGRIERTDDSSNDRYEYNVNAGHTSPPGAPISEEQAVTFDPGPGRVAINVCSDPCDPPGD